MYHNTVHCIVAGMTTGGQIWSQYKNCIVKNSGKRQGCLCRKTGSCVTTRCWTRQQARVGALGRRRACWSTQGECAGVRKASVARAAGGRWVGVCVRASGSWARAQAGGSGARGTRGRALGARQGAGHEAWALGVPPGRAGWPRAVHSVHLACFWLVLTRYFS